MSMNNWIKIEQDIYIALTLLCMVWVDNNIIHLIQAKPISWYEVICYLSPLCLVTHKASIDHHHPSLSTVAARTFVQDSDCQPSSFLSFLTAYLQVVLSLPHSSNSAGIQVVLNLCHKKNKLFLFTGDTTIWRSLHCNSAWSLPRLHWPRYCTRTGVRCVWSGYCCCQQGRWYWKMYSQKKSASQPHSTGWWERAATNTLHFNQSLAVFPTEPWLN